MFHSARFRTYCHATEDIEKVKNALSFVCGSFEISESIAEGYHGNRIIVLEHSAKKSEVRRFWRRIEESGIIEHLRKDFRNRLDDECFFYVRFDKQSAYLGRLRLSEEVGRDVISVKLKVAAYPSKKRVAESLLEEYFENC